MPTALEQELLVAFEVHSPQRIRAAFKAGLDPNAPIGGLPPIVALIEMYYRSPAFPECVAAVLEAGAAFEDRVLLQVLMNDADSLAAALKADRSHLTRRVSLRCTFTPLAGATLLHVAAEYVCLDAARVLLDAGATVDAPAAIDGDGLNGHTPLFHTVNSNANYAQPMMRLLLDAGARPDTAVRGITWGRGFDWETTLFDLTPISYAQAGLLPQFHRNETHIYENVRTLLKASRRRVPVLGNVPNRYLRK